jgi:hypothetical protein
MLSGNRSVSRERVKIQRACGEIADVYLVVIARSEATKQSIAQQERKLDCFAEPVIGRAFARPVGSQ